MFVKYIRTLNWARDHLSDDRPRTGSSSDLDIPADLVVFHLRHCFKNLFEKLLNLGDCSEFHTGHLTLGPLKLGLPSD